MEPRFTAKTFFDERTFENYNKYLMRDYKRHKKNLAFVYTLFIVGLKLSARYIRQLGYDDYFMPIVMVSALFCVFFWFFFKAKLEKNLKEKYIGSYVFKNGYNELEFYENRLLRRNFFKTEKEGISELYKTEKEIYYSDIKNICETESDFYIESFLNDVVPISKSGIKDSGLIVFLHNLKEGTGK